MDLTKNGRISLISIAQRFNIYDTRDRWLFAVHGCYGQTYPEVDVIEHSQTFSTFCLARFPDILE